MNIEVRYLSKSGNTAKVAHGIAAALGVTAKSIETPVPPETELLFLGGAVYAFGIDEELKQFIRDLPQGVFRVAVFSTTAVVKSAYVYMKRELDTRGVPTLPRDFHCHGAFKFMHKGRPNAHDLQNAGAFALETLAEAEKP
jgi:hypothetical protein